jgi:rRNA-processing protein FCF1
MQIRSVSFDTSFLLHYKSSIDSVLKLLARDKIPCFITSTVVSEIERLRVFNRITEYDYRLALKRWKKVKATVIDFKNRLLSDTYGAQCLRAMEKYHGAQEKNVANDCKILVSNLKNGVDLFLSEDYHFTSKITKKVIKDVKSVACTEFHQMCDTVLYNIDAETFLKAYKNGFADIDIIESNLKNIKKG